MDRDERHAPLDLPGRPRDEAGQCCATWRTSLDGGRAALAARSRAATGAADGHGLVVVRRPVGRTAAASGGHQCRRRAVVDRGVVARRRRPARRSASRPAADRPRRCSSVDAHPGHVALTNTAGSAITASASAVVPMLARRRDQRRRVPQLPAHAGGAAGARGAARRASRSDLGTRVGVAADATEWLLEHREDWLVEAAERLDGPNGVWCLAPAERISSALQSGADVPRRTTAHRRTAARRAIGATSTCTSPRPSTTGPWCSPAADTTAAAAEWMRQRGSTAVAVGSGPFDVAQQVVRFPGDDDPIVSTADRGARRRAGVGVTGGLATDSHVLWSGWRRLRAPHEAPGSSPVCSPSAKVVTPRLMVAR